MPVCGVAAGTTAPGGAETNDSSSRSSMFSFSAFGTVGEVHSSQDKADFTASVFNPNGAGYTRSWSPEVDSLVGGQVSAQFTAGLTAVLQVVAEQNYNGTYAPHVEWANLKYQFTPDSSVRLGRSVLHNFLFSDTRAVGYTYLWVRPPIEVYSLDPATTNDGVDFSYRLHAADVTDTVQGHIGQSVNSLPDNRGVSRGRDSWGVSDIAEYRSFTLMATFQRVRLTIASPDALFDAFRLFGAQGNAIANHFDDDNKILVIEQVGASYDSGHWLVASEWTHANTNSFLGDQTAWYCSAGYRVGKFTPYLTYSEVNAAGNSAPGLTLAGLPPAAAGFAAGLNAALGSLLEVIAVQRTVSAGMRWDFIGNFDLKLQIDHMRLGAESEGTLVNVQPGFHPGGTVNLFSANVDFVF
jgi:hypothetical protein